MFECDFVIQEWWRNTNWDSRGGKWGPNITFFVAVQILWFLGHFLSTFSNRNDCEKF